MSLAAIVTLVLIFVFVVFWVVPLAFGIRRRVPVNRTGQTRILRMRDEGKLSPAEAEDLLLALKSDAPNSVPALPDRHLRRAGFGLMVIGVVAMGLTIVSAGSAIRNASVWDEVRQEFNGLPADQVSPGVDREFESRFVNSTNLFQALGIGFSFASVLIAVGAIASGLVFVSTKAPRWRRLARSFGLTAFVASLLVFPLGTLLGAYGIWVLAIRNDAGRPF